MCVSLYQYLNFGEYDIPESYSGFLNSLKEVLETPVLILSKKIIFRSYWNNMKRIPYN